MVQSVRLNSSQERQERVIFLLACGWSNESIARETGATPNSVRLVIAHYCKRQNIADIPRHAVVFYSQRYLSGGEWFKLQVESRKQWHAIPEELRTPELIKLIETWLLPEHRLTHPGDIAAELGWPPADMFQIFKEILASLGCPTRSYAVNYSLLLVIYRAAILGERDA